MCGTVLYLPKNRNHVLFKNIQGEHEGRMLCLQGKGLEAFFKGGKVCGDNKLYCSGCNNKQDADVVSVFSLMVST